MTEESSQPLAQSALGMTSSNTNLEDRNGILRLQQQIELLIKSQEDNSSAEELQEVVEKVESKQDEIKQLNARISALQSVVEGREADLARAEAAKKDLEREAAADLRDLQARYNILKRKVHLDSGEKDNSLLRKKYEEVVKENEYLKRSIAQVPVQQPEIHGVAQPTTPEQKTIQQLRQQRSQLQREVEELKGENERLTAQLAVKQREDAQNTDVQEKYAALLQEHSALQHRFKVAESELETLRTKQIEKQASSFQRAGLALSPSTRTRPSANAPVLATTASPSKAQALRISQLQAANEEQKGRIDEILKDKNQLFSRNQQLVAENAACRAEIERMKAFNDRYQRLFQNYEKMQQNSGEIKRHLLAIKRIPASLEIGQQLNEIVAATERFLVGSCARIRAQELEIEDFKRKTGYLSGQICIFEQQKREQQQLAQNESLSAVKRIETTYRSLISRFVKLHEDQTVIYQLETFLDAQHRLAGETFDQFGTQLNALTQQSGELEAKIMTCIRCLDSLEQVNAESIAAENRELRVQLAAANMYARELEDRLSSACDAARIVAICEEEDCEHDGAIPDTRRSFEENAKAKQDLDRMQQLSAQNEHLMEEVLSLKQQVTANQAAAETSATALQSRISSIKRTALQQVLDFCELESAQTQQGLDSISEHFYALTRMIAEECADFEAFGARMLGIYKAVMDAFSCNEEMYEKLSKITDSATARQEQTQLNCRETIQEQERQLLSANRHLADLEKQYAALALNSQTAARAHENEVQQLNLLLDDKNSAITMQQYEIQQLEADCAEKDAALQSALQNAQHLSDELQNEKSAASARLEALEIEKDCIVAELSKAEQGIAKLETELAAETEKTQLAQEAKNSEARQFIQRIELLDSENAQIKQNSEVLQQELANMETEKLQLIERASEATQRLQLAEEETQQTRKAAIELEQQIDERKAAKSDRLEKLNERIEELQAQLTQSQEDKTIFEHEAKQQLLVFEQNAVEKEKAIRTELELRTEASQKLELCIAELQTELETVRNQILNTSDDSEAVEQLKKLISEKELLNEAIGERDSTIEQLDTQLSELIQENKENYMQIEELKKQLDIAEEQTASKAAELASVKEELLAKQQGAIMQAKDYLNQIEGLSRELTQKDVEMEEFETEVEELSAQKLHELNKQMELQGHLQDVEEMLEQAKAQAAEKASEKSGKTADQLAALQHMLSEANAEKEQTEQRLEQQLEIEKHAAQKSRETAEQLRAELQDAHQELAELNAVNQEILQAQQNSGYIKLQNQTEEIRQLQSQLSDVQQENGRYRQELMEQNKQALDAGHIIDEREKTASGYELGFATLMRFIAGYELSDCADIQRKLEVKVQYIEAAFDEITTKVIELARGGNTEKVKAELEELAQEKTQLTQRQLELQEQLQESHGVQALYEQQLIAAQDEINEMQQAEASSARKKAGRK